MEIPSYDDSHFALLPEELLVELILRYVSISDLWNFCDAFKDIEHLLKELALTRNINLKIWYDANTSRIFSNINAENVTSLNLNYCHWLPHEDLVSFVGKCANLETLLALGTQLGLTDQEVKCYNKIKINKLAVTQIKDKPLARTAALDRVTSLALDIDAINFELACPSEDLNRIIPSLQRLWVDLLRKECSNYLPWLHKFLKTYKSLQLQKLFIKSNNVCIKPETFGDQYAEAIYDCSNLCLSYIGMHFLCFGNNSFGNVDNVKNTENFGFFKPYGRKVAKLLQSGARTLETIQFEELNFYRDPFRPYYATNHGKYQHYSDHKALLQLLMSPNARNIEKLTLCVCLLDHYKDVNNPESDSPILRRFTSLRFLQLFCCNKPTPTLRNLQEYNSLANLAKLRYLFVQMPNRNDDNFLFDGLKHSENLKELVLENFSHICIDDLLSLLIESKIKLQKLSMDCLCACRIEEMNDYARVKYPFCLNLLCEYMQSNPQLTDCQFRIDGLPNANIAFIKQQVSTFNTSYTNFYIGSDASFCNSAHYRFNPMDDIGSF